MKLWRGLLVVLIIGIIIVAGCYFFGNNKDNGDDEEIQNGEIINGNLNQTNNKLVMKLSLLDLPLGQAVVKENTYVPIIE